MKRGRIKNVLRAERRIEIARKIPFFVVFATLVVAVLMPAAVTAHSYKLGNIAVGHIWAPLSESNATGVPVYGPILNRGSTTARLVGASTSITEQVRFRIKKDGEVWWPAAIKLRSGKPVALAAWREHIWLSGLNKPLKEGDSFDMTLDFGKAGSLTVMVVVEGASGH